MRKVVVANRGEIAVRVIRACREAGLGSVAVFSEADRDAPHVGLADEAYLIGPPPSSQSYLVGERILEVAARAGADAVHPGYGFLAENARFAAACRDAGLTFIGPSPEAMAVLGDKTTARRAAMKVGVPVVPGTEGPVGSDEEAARAARGLGYPVMIKAAHGGGGKGMRLCADPAELAGALRLARSEATSSFGDGAVYLEKAIVEPRHVEIQALADAHGHVVHLGERECSTQRRHQKLIEESPSPAVDPPLRATMGEAACRLLESVGYRNAGTVEFLLDAEGRFYFLEVNTRLQVEHPVTELVTGLDLVQAQLGIAAGEPLPFRQDDVRLRGWAIECRISAEDPDAGFLPCPGRITAWRPSGGPGVRVDAGVREGTDVPLHYDPLLAKLIVWGPDRAAAIRRMRGALAGFGVAGVRTTIPFHLAALAHPDFAAGRLSTGFAERVRSGGNPVADPRVTQAAAVAALLEAFGRARPAPADGTAASAGAPRLSPWARASRPGAHGDGW